MQKTPTYVGIFVEDPKVANKQIKNYIQHGLTQLIKTIQDQQSEQAQDIQKDLDNFDQTFKPPNDNYHITTLFIGGNEKKLKPEQVNQYKNFKNNKNTFIKMDCILYVPGYLICSYCSSTDNIQVDNKYPHVTLFLGGNAKAVESNTFLEQVAKKHPGILQKKQFKTGKYQIQFGKFNEVYLINNQLQLKAITGNNFVLGKR